MIGVATYTYAGLAWGNPSKRTTSVQIKTLADYEKLKTRLDRKRNIQAPKTDIVKPLTWQQIFDRSDP